MPPPRPKGTGFTTGVTPARPSSNTPMSERQQMALLIQMTATSSTETSTKQSKKNDKKGDAETDEVNVTEKQLEITEAKDKPTTTTAEETSTDAKNVETNVAQNVTSTKRSYSDIEEDNEEHGDDVKKKKKKDLDNVKDTKATTLKISSKLDKNAKQATTKSSPSTSKVTATVVDKEAETSSSNKTVEVENETEGSEDYKSNDSSYNGGLKVPPLKIVIPQQNCSIDTDGNVLRTGKVAASRNAALPYVVSSNSDSIDTILSNQCLSPHESPQKVNIACSTILDDKNIKLFNDEKNLRVLRSSYRSGVTSAERSSNNSSPQMQSSSPSPASSNHATDNADIKVTYTNMTSSPIPQNQFDQEVLTNVPSPSTSSTSSSKEINSSSNVDLHPRKRKIRPKNNDDSSKNANAELVSGESHPHDSPFTNGFQMFLNIRRQVERKWKNLYPVKPRPPQGYNDFLLTTRSYLLKNDAKAPEIELPEGIPEIMKDFYKKQENDRRDLVEKHTVEREKLCLSVEQEIIRVHSKAARSISGQCAPYSVCTFLKDDEVYNMITPEQDEKEKSARCRFNGRLLLSWLQDVDDKWEKIKESMVLRQHNEAESLHAVQSMDWNISLRRNKLYSYIFDSSEDRNHVPIVYVGEDFDTLPA